MFLINSWQEYFSCGPSKERQTLSRSYSRFFAEFLEDLSLVRLGLLALITCVGLRYGAYMIIVEAFLGRLFTTIYLPEGKHFCRLDICIKAESRIYLRFISRASNPNPLMGCYLYSPSLHRTCMRHGILTVCPSSPAFAIPLGPTNPSLIFIAKETLIFRRMGISPILWLLVPTFLLRNAPVWVTPSPSVQMRILSYRSTRANTCEALNFGT